MCHMEYVLPKFSVHFSNITKAELISKLHTMTRDKQQRAYSSFALCVLSRGGIGSVTMADLGEFYIDELLDRLDSNNFPAMAGKPKFIFIDTNNKDLISDTGLMLPKSAATGHTIGKTGPLELAEVIQSSTVGNETPKRYIDQSSAIIDELGTKVARKSDFVVYLASFPHYTALHHNKMGSLTTRVLVETFYKHCHKYHVIELAMKIRRKLGSKLLMGTQQMLTTMETLSKDFYLFPLPK